MSTPYHKQYKNNNPTLDWFDNAKYSGLHGLDDVAIYKLLSGRSELLNRVLKERKNTEYQWVAVRKKFEFITNDPLEKDSTLMEDFMNEALGDIRAKRQDNSLQEPESELKENIIIDDSDFDIKLAIKGASYDEPVNGLGVDDDGCAFYTLMNLFEDGEWVPETRSYIEFTPEMLTKEFHNVVKVNLHAPETEIRDSFNRWLKQAQKEIGAIKKPSFLVDKSSLIKHSIFQYLDLWIYQELEGVKLTRCEIAQILFGNDPNGISRIDDSTKPKAMKFVSGSYLHWLKEVVFKPTNEEIEHGKKLKEVLRKNGLSGDVVNPEKYL